MKRNTLIILSMLLSMGALKARPVDVETAQSIGLRFANANFAVQCQPKDLQLVYTGVSERNEPCFYTFNVGTDGFVIVSADDRFRPIVGYSDEGPFETKNMSPELEYYLGKIVEARTSRNAVLLADTEAEWASVKRTGRLLSRNGGKSATYICTTKWNQDSPYNLYAPEAGNGPGGRCYAGCVATAMSQVMKRWNKPLKGTGSHSYYSYGHGQLSANFGATTYDWDNMPDRIGGNSATEEIEAVALLMYHCGVAVNMGFSPNGSGAYSSDVPDAISQYFSYSDHAVHEGRDSYSLVQWQNKLKESIDLTWPLYYSGYSESGGHAFVCDGYDDNDLFHFNWGWGGSSDGWFVIDEIDYASWASAIFNHVPSEVYLHMTYQPDNLSVTSLHDNDFSAILTWTNPSINIQGEALDVLDQIVVTRNGTIIHTEDNVAAGAEMSFTDHYMPTVVTYSVYAVNHNAKGLEAVEENVSLGPNCPWTIEMESSNPQGWTDGYLSLRNSQNIEIGQMTATSASTTIPFDMPIGKVSVHWNRLGQNGETVSFRINDAQGQTQLAFDSESGNLPNGLIYILNNGCGNNDRRKGPEQLSANSRENFVDLSWSYTDDVICYLVYRDRMLIGISTEKNFTDNQTDEAYHNYYVSALRESGESDPSNLCDTRGEGECEAPANLRYEVVSPTKAKIMWDAPQAEGVTGYKLYRRAKGEDFKCIKLLTTTSHTDNINSQPAGRYEYTVTAYYNSNKCESGYATTLGHPELNVVEVNKTIIPQELSAEADGDVVTLQWQPATLAETYNIYRNDSLIASDVVETVFTDSITFARTLYCYTVTGKNAFMESNPSNEASVVSTANYVENNSLPFAFYPNPTQGPVNIESKGIQLVVVFNQFGQEVMRRSIEADQAHIDLGTLPNGTYFIKAISEQGISVQKVVKI